MTFRSHPSPAEWDDFVGYESTSWPKKDPRRYWIIPSICFNCESACGLLAYVDRDTMQVRKYEGNPEHPVNQGKLCSRGQAGLQGAQTIGCFDRALDGLFQNVDIVNPSEELLGKPRRTQMLDNIFLVSNGDFGRSNVILLKLSQKIYPAAVEGKMDLYHYYLDAVF